VIPTNGQTQGDACEALYYIVKKKKNTADMSESGGVNAEIGAMRARSKDSKMQKYGRSTLQKLVIVC